MLLFAVIEYQIQYISIRCQVIPTTNPISPKIGINLQNNNGLIAINWQKLKQLPAKTSPIHDCLNAAKEAAATPRQVNPRRQRNIIMAGIIAIPTSEPLPPAIKASITGE